MKPLNSVLLEGHVSSIHRAPNGELLSFDLKSKNLLIRVTPTSQRNVEDILKATDRDIVRIVGSLFGGPLDPITVRAEYLEIRKVSK